MWLRLRSWLRLRLRLRSRWRRRYRLGLRLGGSIGLCRRYAFRFWSRSRPEVGSRRAGYTYAGAWLPVEPSAIIVSGFHRHGHAHFSGDFPRNGDHFKRVFAKLKKRPAFFEKQRREADDNNGRENGRKHPSFFLEKQRQNNRDQNKEAEEKHVKSDRLYQIEICAYKFDGIFHILGNYTKARYELQLDMKYS